MNITDYEKYGFKKDEKLFDRIIQYPHLDEVHVDTYLENPYMLFLRTDANNVMPIPSNSRITLTKNDKYRTVILDIPKDEIREKMIKVYETGAYKMYELIFFVFSVRYDITIIIS